ncbi:hypothetical protein D3C86_2008640 [compost metagenome]
MIFAAHQQQSIGIKDTVRQGARAERVAVDDQVCLELSKLSLGVINLNIPQQ